MYTLPTSKQIAHLTRKISEGTVYEFGDSKFSPNMLKYYKAAIPYLMAPKTPQDIWEELGFTWSTSNKKADVVLAGNYLENTMDVNNRMKEMWKKGKVGSYFMFAGPTAVNQGYLALQPNYWLSLINNNDIDVSYFQIGDGRGQHVAVVDSSKTYRHGTILDLLHKFVETRELITNITIQKKSTKELVCPQ